jgi:hypothetical protein
VSRLDSFIRRLSAQRDCLNMAAKLVGEAPGPVLELGLGNGRTFDHLRGLFPDRQIFVFDRRVAAHPDCIPDEAHMILGDIFETLPAAGARIGAPAVLAHSDIGTGIVEENARIAAFLGRELPRLMASRALIMADQPLDPEAWTSLPLPHGVKPDRYFIYQRG